MCCKLLDTTDYDRPVGGIEWREGDIFWQYLIRIRDC